jgi:selenide,water dikinase
MTDVTGFGLAGHLMAICRASHLGAEVDMGQVAVYDGALEASQSGVKSTLYEANVANAPVFGAEGPLTALLHDPQTAGGFLAAVAEDEAADVLAALAARGVQAARIGRMTEGPVGITLV